MATVIFQPKRQVVREGIFVKTESVCSRACGSSECIRARMGNKCPTNDGSKNLILCVSQWFLQGRQQQAATNGLMKEIELFA